MTRGVDMKKSKVDSPVIGAVIEGEVVPTEAPNTRKKPAHKQYGEVTYTTKTILKRLRIHMVDNMLSKHSMSKPTFAGIQKRMDNGDTELEEGVKVIITEHYAEFEKLNIQAIRGEVDVDSKMFRIATQNKRPYLSPEQAMIADGIAPTVAPVAPQLHFHQIGTREDFEQLENRDKSIDEV